MEGTHELRSTLGVCLVGKLKNRLKSRVYEASRGIKTGGMYRRRRQGKKRKIEEETEGGREEILSASLSSLPTFHHLSTVCPDA